MTIVIAPVRKFGFGTLDSDFGLRLVYYEINMRIYSDSLT